MHLVSVVVATVGAIEYLVVVARRWCGVSVASGWGGVRDLVVLKLKIYQNLTLFTAAEGNINQCNLWSGRLQVLVNFACCSYEERVIGRFVV